MTSLARFDKFKVIKDTKLPDLSKARGKDDERELAPQKSAEDTSNWITELSRYLYHDRPYAEFISGDNDKNLDFVDSVTNPYVEQERLKSVKHKK